MQRIQPGATLGVDHPTIVIAGPAGFCKTSMGTTWNTVLLDFDNSAARAIRRAPVVPIASWADVSITREELADVDGVTIDTIERCLSFLTTALLEQQPRLGANGILYPRGHTILRQRLVAFLDSIRNLQRSTLVIAHTKEERDEQGRARIRIDAPAGAIAELLKRADVVGYLTIRGSQRWLEFDPSDKWVAKNPGRWPAIKVPGIDQADGFVAELFARARATLKGKAAESAVVVGKVDTWRREIAALETAAAFNAILPRVLALNDPTLQPQVKRLLWERAKAIGVLYDAQLAQFVAGPAAGYVPAPRPPARTDRAAAWQPALGWQSVGKTVGGGPF